MALKQEHEGQGANHENSAALPRVEKGSMLDLCAGIHWDTEDCHFSDWRYLPNINLWRDYLPLEIEAQLQNQSIAAHVNHVYPAGELVEGFQSSQVKQLKLNQFQPDQSGHSQALLQVGRFFSKDSFKGVDGIYQGNKFPCRVVAIDDQYVTVDFNHPLASRDINLELVIEQIKSAAAERGGRCNDIPALLCDYGPGMQANPEQQPIGFSSPNAIKTLDQSKEEDFFASANLEPFWDKTALNQVTSLYNELLSDDMDILDLMAGVHSPLQQASIRPAHVFCAGLNRSELEANPICADRQLINVNDANALAGFEDARFDAVLIHAAIEYVTNPHDLMHQIGRILKPGGRIIISFSNRSMQGKAINIWHELDEFERPALVLGYLKNAHCYTAFNSYSMRGRFRPEDDQLSSQLLYSDPVYAVWANRVS